MFHPKGLRPSQEARETPIVGRALCLTPKDSPGLGRVSHLSERFQDSLTMFSDTDELVAKISAMFPTVSHTHIRILLKKYYNREAVVISALQVEKHPIATPGPLTMSPSAARLPMGAGPSNMGMLPANDFPGPSQGCSRNQPRLGAPQGSSPGRIMTSGYIRGMRQRQSENQTARHSSPKMKLKYLKSVYPKADETFILEVLANNDNNIQMAGQDLEAMGFVKKERTQPKNKELIPQPPKKVVLMRTIEDRNQLFAKLQRKYWSVPERLIQIALESVDYNEERANYILMVLLKERTSPILNPQDDQQPRRSSLIELPDAAWFPSDGRVSSLQARSAEPMHAPALAAPQVSALPILPFTPPAVPAAPAAPVAPAVPAYGPVAAPLAPAATPPVPVYVPSPVHAHMAANASAHMAAYAQQHPHLPAHVLAFGSPPVPIFPPQFRSAFAPMQAQARVQAHALAQAQAQAYAQAFAQTRVNAHAQAQAVAAAAPPMPPAPPAPDTRRPKQWNDHVKVVAQPNTAQAEPNNYQSQYHNAAAGPNPAMRQGPQDNLLLEDYMPWNGPNPELRRGQPARPERPEQPAIQFPLARGPSGLAQGPSGIARGPSGLARGPAGRAQGSMYPNRQRGKK